MSCALVTMLMIGAAIISSSPFGVAKASPSIRTSADEMHVIADDLKLRRLGQPDISIGDISENCGSLQATLQTQANVDADITSAAAGLSAHVAAVSTQMAAQISTCRAEVAEVANSSATRTATLERELAETLGHLNETRDQLTAVTQRLANLSQSVSQLDQLLPGGELSPGATCWSLRSAGITRSGVYWVTSGRDIADAFQVYCDMQFEGGGWTLVDNHPRESEPCPWTRNGRAGAVLNHTHENRMALLSAYTWHAQPRMVVKSSATTNGNNPNNWVMLEPTGSVGRSYPTRTTGAGGSHTGQWNIITTNGNRNYGTRSWIYGDGDGSRGGRSSRFGTVWIGAGHQPTAACCYVGGQSGLGRYTQSQNSASHNPQPHTCSTWVR